MAERSENGKPAEIEKQHLATGWLQWPSKERRSDRYGTVRLYKFDPNENETSFAEYSDLPLGKYGRLIAEVIEAQESSHVGDLFRGLFPQTPEIGDCMELGEGTLFTEADEWSQVVGLRPLEERGSDWLNPEVLYRLHDQRVRLFFEELEGPTIKVSSN